MDQFIRKVKSLSSKEARGLVRKQIETAGPGLLIPALVLVLVSGATQLLRPLIWFTKGDCPSEIYRERLYLQLCHRVDRLNKIFHT